MKRSIKNPAIVQCIGIVYSGFLFPNFFALIAIKIIRIPPMPPAIAPEKEIISIKDARLKINIIKVKNNTGRHVKTQDIIRFIFK